MNMKFFTPAIVAVAVSISALNVAAQPTGPRFVTDYGGAFANGSVSNSATYISAPGTNTYFVTCEEFEAVPLVMRFAGTDASTSTVRVDAYRSFNSTLWETAPYRQQYATMNGTSPVMTFTNLAVEGAAVLKIVVGNTNDTVAVTNLELRVNRKAKKEAVFPTSR